MTGPVDRSEAFGPAGGPVGGAAAARFESLLASAGELLRAEQVEAADREIAQAIALVPDEPRAQNLMAMVRYRAGRYQEAYAVYRDLCARAPDDTSLRLNLGLVELRMGRNPEAAQSLRRVVEREPDNLKAQGYLGLALMRGGELAPAREAFVRAGQPDLVRQVDEQLAAVPHPVAGPTSSVELRRGDDNVTRPMLDAEALPRSIRPQPPRAAPATPLTSTLASTLTAALPLPLSRFIDQHHAPAVAGEPFAVAVAVDALLAVLVEGRLFLRMTGAVASSGRLSYAPVNRHVRGRVTDEPFGEGDDALVQASGTGTVLVSPRGGRFTPLRLGEPGDALYLRESALFAFEESLSWDNGRIPGSPERAEAVVQLRGAGRLVLRSRRAPTTLRIEPGQTYYVDQAALIGWSGEVVPQQLRGGDGEPTQFIACAGQGALVLDEPVSESPAAPAPPQR